MPGRIWAVVLFRLLDLPFDFADGREIFVEFAAVGGAEIRFQLPGVVRDEIQNATPVGILARAGFGGQCRAGAEQPFEEECGGSGSAAAAACRSARRDC